MTKPMIRIHNADTNEVIDREMTDEEFAQHEIDAQSAAEEAAQKAAKAAAKQAVLDKLGLTAEELADALS
jgi:hypothetical protein